MRRPTADLVAVPVWIEAGGIPRGPDPFRPRHGLRGDLRRRRAGRALGLAATSRGTIVTATGAIQAIASRASFTFGSLRVNDLEMVRDPLTALRAVAPDIRGVLGQDVLRRANWLLDYRLGIVIQDPDRLAR